MSDNYKEERGFEPESPDVSTPGGIVQVSTEEVNEILSKYDKESAFRRLTGTPAMLITAIAISFSCFHIYTALFGVFPAQIQRAVHLTFALVLAYLMYPFSQKLAKDKMHPVDAALSLVSLLVGAYPIINYEALIRRAGSQTPFDIFVAILAILLVLEATRRVVGIPICVIASVFLIYSKFGMYLPGFLNHRGYSVSRIVSHMYYTTEGILGLPLGVSSTFIFLFILFGAFLDKTGIGKFFIDLANSVAGARVGGPAKVAVLSSALTGTISGSSVANTVTTGSFSIPLMKSLGYKPEFAGAVEAAASTGGQIMPPVMGAAAFLMAEFTGIPYSKIIISAILPAVLYFTGIWIMVHLEALKTGLKALGKDEVPSAAKILLERGYLFLPLIAIFYFLISGTTPIKAALYGIVVAVIASSFGKKTRMSPVGFVQALEQGAKSALGVAIACACAGIIVGTVTLTGLGLKMGNGLISLAQGHLLPTLFFTMITSLILGMGAPTTANYIITSTIAAPALLKLGVPVMAAHMFVFYFGIIADITPPVALAAFAGSAIAKGDPFKTGVNASRLAIAAFIIPYIFVMNPAILLIDTTPLQVVQIAATSLLGMYAIAIAMQGYIYTNVFWPLRFLFAAAGLMMIDPGTYTDIGGLVIVVVLVMYQRMVAKRAKTA